MLFNTLDLRYQPLNERQSKKNKKVNVLLENLSEITTITDNNISEVLSKNKDIHYISEGRFSTHQIVERILEYIESAELLIATWAITETPLRTLERLKKEGKIIKIEALIERKVPSHNPKAFAYANAFFDKIDLATCHAKVSLLKNENCEMTLVTSSNWTVNRRLEVGTISCNPKLYEFHKNWIDGIRS